MGRIPADIAPFPRRMVYADGVTVAMRFDHVIFVCTDYAFYTNRLAMISGANTEFLRVAVYHQESNILICRDWGWLPHRFALLRRGTKEDLERYCAGGYG